MACIGTKAELYLCSKVIADSGINITKPRQYGISERSQNETTKVEENISPESNSQQQEAEVVPDKTREMLLLNF